MVRVRAKNGRWRRRSSASKVPECQDVAIVGPTAEVLNVKVIPVYDSVACHQTVVEGRRVVDISFLCEQLSEGCAFCKHILRHGLPMVRREVRYGLASSFDIQCEAAGCQALNKVFTSKQHRGSATRGPKVFDVNTKLGLGKESCSALLRCAGTRACLHHGFHRLAFAVYLVMSS